MILSSNSKTMWAGFSALACASILFCYQYFHQLNPLASLSITIDRNDAVEISKDLGVHYQWPLENAHTAVMFGSKGKDFLIQPFADLETGGNDNYRIMIEKGFYCPYQWTVRFFKEHSADEVMVYLTPDGKPYGFEHTVPEDRELASLTEKEARSIAQQQAQTTWNIDLSIYKEVEASHNTTPKGRTDYTFVYERTDATLMGTGKYRLTLEVCGNQVTTIMHSVKIPEIFLRTFEATVSKNNFLAQVATFLMYIFYVLGGCLIGGYFLFNRNMFSAKMAIIWASIIGLLQAIMLLNNLPLIWIHYKTSLSVSSFLSSYALSGVFQTISIIAYCALAFSIATSLDNWAFPHHVRFWSLWSSSVASSRTILGQTIGGYLGALTWLGEITAVLILFLRVFKWWAPTNPLINPNILATPLPWVSAFAMSAQAGFLEECLFRAIPLAGSVILGRYLKREKLIVSLGFILQVFIFAAAHANYPQQPFYFRLVELAFPSSVMGLVYLAYGLLPCIICHFIYDLILMGIPVWVAHSHSAMISKFILALLALIPLLIIIVRRIRAGHWVTLSKADYNDGHTEHHEPVQQETKKSIHYYKLSHNSVVFLVLAGCIGVTTLWYCGKRDYDAPALQVHREEAITLARQQIPKDFLFAEQHSVLTQLVSKITPEHIFVWQTSGKETYQQLLGNYLLLPSWKIRFISFDAEKEQRAEEYDVVVDAYGTIFSTKLILPEHKTLPSLSKSEAQAMALKALTDTYRMSNNDLQQISAQPIDQPNRTDWVFTFKYLPIALTDGYAQIKVLIAGNIIQSINRSVFVPEVWKRNFEHKESIKANVAIVFSFIFIVLLLIAISAFGTPFLKKLKIQNTLSLCALLLFLFFISIVNQLPAITGFFSTAQAYSTQLFGVLISMVFLSLLRIIIVSLYTVHISSFVNQTQLQFPGIFFIGLLGGFVVRTAHVFGKWLVPLYMPLWGTYEYANAYLPSIAVALAYFFLMLRNTIFGTIAVSFINSLESRPRNTFFRFIFIFLGVYASIGAFETVSSGIAIGLTVTAAVLIMYRLLLSYDSTLWIPLLTGYFVTYAAGELTAQLFAGYGIVMALIGLASIVLSYRWFNRIRKEI